MAEEIKRLLQAGEPCPVCDQTVKHVPKSERHPSIEQATKSLLKYEKELTDLNTSRSNIQVEIDLLAPQMNNKLAEIKEVEVTIDEATVEIRVVLKKSPGADAGAELEKLRQQVMELQSKVESAEVKLNIARESEAKAKESMEEFNRQLITIRSDVSSGSEELQRLQNESKTLRKTLGKFTDASSVKAELKRQDDAKRALDADLGLKEAEGNALSKAKDELAEASRVLEGLKVKAEGMERSTTKIRESVKQLKVDLQRAVPNLKIDLEGHGQDPAAQLDLRLQLLQTERDEVQRKILQCEEEIRALNVQIKRAVELRTETEKRRAAAAVAHDLALSLRGDQFIAFIQQEAYHRLAIDGSRHLKTLSSERYSFGFEKDEFVVLDHWNADEPRPVTTLSGGESFLASLALALGLAEGLSGLSHGHGRFALESLFLDEGFGTLDAETLDVVLQGVENLSTTDRLVGIVSHIPELADRMPSRIHIRKTPGGSTVELRT
jgi:exonuclease SbcC